MIEEDFPVQVNDKSSSQFRSIMTGRVLSSGQ